MGACIIDNIIPIYMSHLLNCLSGLQFYIYFNLRFYAFSNVVDCTSLCTGRRKANWGVEASKPFWWSGCVEFVDINNSRSRPRFQQLHLILEAFRDWRQQGLQPDEEMDEDCTHDPHSPESLTCTIHIPDTCTIFIHITCTI